MRVDRGHRRQVTGCPSLKVHRLGQIRQVCAVLVDLGYIEKHEHIAPYDSPGPRDRAALRMKHQHAPVIRRRPSGVLEVVALLAASHMQTDFVTVAAPRAAVCGLVAARASKHAGLAT